MDSTALSLILASLTAIAATVSPVVQSISNNRTQLRLKSMDLLYRSRLDAYSRVMDAAGDFERAPSPAASSELFKSVDKAVLVAGPDAHEILISFSATLVSHIKAPNFELLASARAELFRALQSDISKHQPN